MHWLTSHPGYDVALLLPRGCCTPFSFFFFFFFHEISLHAFHRVKDEEPHAIVRWGFLSDSQHCRAVLVRLLVGDVGRCGVGFVWREEGRRDGVLDCYLV